MQNIGYIVLAKVFQNLIKILLKKELSIGKQGDGHEN